MKKFLRCFVLMILALLVLLPVNPTTEVSAEDAEIKDSTVLITVGETNRNYTRYVIHTDNPYFDRELIYSDPAKVSFKVADSSVAELVSVEKPVSDERESYDYLGHHYTNQWNRSYYTVKALAPGTTHVEVYYDGKKVFDQPDIIVSSPIHMWRLYNPNSGEHFYTGDTHERDSLVSLGWKNEGIGWNAPVDGEPVYRLYNRNGGEHHYTLSTKERDSLIKAGWKDEGTGWYSDEAETIPVYRQYNPNAFANNHNYSTSKAENDHLVSIGWKSEGVGWYAISAGK